MTNKEPLDEVVLALVKVQRHLGDIVDLEVTVDSDGVCVWWRLGRHEGEGIPWSVTGQGETLEEAVREKNGLRLWRRRRR